MSADIGEIKKKYGFGDDTTGKLKDFGFIVSDEGPRPSAEDIIPSSSYSYAAPPPPLPDLYETSTPSSSLRHDTDEGPAPRRMSIKGRATASTVIQQALFMEDDDVTSTVSTTAEEEVPETQPPQSLSQADSLLNDSTIVPLPKMTRSPFRKSPKTSLNTSSVFDNDSSSTGMGKKRVAEEETLKPTTTKQMKLSFGSASAKGKENGRSAYSLWLASQEETLRSIFNGFKSGFYEIFNSFSFFHRQKRRSGRVVQSQAIDSCHILTS
ncbi:unnamed protein product [Cylicocyclus nassatus]|uniref:Uncharacterized protein n=1 Tax=Cylicocyclus nassatus TaxID=53992 RepID=A0AA36HCD4_CYLNA|nr:unnamed protein product [Cylicocyclus nassatus]